VSAGIAARGRKFLVAALLTGFLLLTLGFIILKILQPERFDHLLALKDGRWAIWRTSIEMVGNNPWLGAGGSDLFQAQYREIYPHVVPDIPSEFPQGAPHAHNTLLSYAALHGVPLALAWLAMVACPCLWLWRRRFDHPKLFQATIGIVVMALIFGQFEKLDGATSRVLWTGLGLMVALMSARPSPVDAAHSRPAPPVGS
jgi:O-antigen ligase